MSSPGPPLSLADEAYVLLRRRLTRCETAPGTRFTARGVAFDLGLGLTPVREALLQLEREHLVVTLPRRGYLATPLTRRLIGDALATWRILEPRVVALAAQHPDPDPAPGPAPPVDDPRAGAEARGRQRQALAARTRNSLLEDVVRFLDGHLLRLQLRAVQRLGASAAQAAAGGIDAFEALVTRHLDRLADPGTTPADRTADGTAGRPSPAATTWARVRADIVRGALAPGTRLTERRLAAQLGVGLTPVREALSRLDHERLVTTVPRRGYVVTRTSARDVAEASQVWSMLVEDLLELAVRHATDEQARAVVAAVLPVRPGDDPELFVRRSAGWRLLARATGNALLAGVFELLDGVLARSVAELHTNRPPPLEVTAQQWTELFARRDPVAARALAAEYAAWVDGLARRLTGQDGQIYQRSRPRAAIFDA